MWRNKDPPPLAGELLLLQTQGRLEFQGRLASLRFSGNFLHFLVCDDVVFFACWMSSYWLTSPGDLSTISTVLYSPGQIVLRTNVRSI